MCVDQNSAGGMPFPNRRLQEGGIFHLLGFWLWKVNQRKNTFRNASSFFSLGWKCSEAVCSSVSLTGLSSRWSQSLRWLTRAKASGMLSPSEQKSSSTASGRSSAQLNTRSSTHGHTHWRNIYSQRSRTIMHEGKNMYLGGWRGHNNDSPPQCLEHMHLSAPLKTSFTLLYVLNYNLEVCQKYWYSDTTCKQKK